MTPSQYLAYSLLFENEIKGDTTLAALRVDLCGKCSMPRCENLEMDVGRAAEVARGKIRFKTVAPIA